MGKYYQAIKRDTPESIFSRRVSPPTAPVREIHTPLPTPAESGALVPRPLFPDMPGTLAKAAALRNLSERVAPQASIDRQTRLLVSGCSPSEGTSTIAAALAIDLSQRLNLRTLVVD